MRKFINKRATTTLSIATLALTLSACNSMPTSQRSIGSSSESLPKEITSYDEHAGYRKSFYAATGLGISHLEPNTSERNGVDVNDPTNAGGQITIGADVNRHLSIEVHSADLGSAGLSPTGRINYHLHGGSALFYVGKNRKRYKRVGLSAYGRLGYGVLENSPVGDVDFRKINGNHFLFGLGMEYATRSGLGIRAELISFEEDANYAQLALIYRLGKKRKQIREIVAQIEPEPEIVEEPVMVKPIPAVAVVVKDHDRDGVIDAVDQCPTTKPGVSVDLNGCALFAGVIQGVNFHSGSDVLTDTAQTVLVDVANTLSKYPNVRVLVKAHTDSQGGDQFNQTLSEKRARSVVTYLVGKGIRANRFTARAYGETRPIDTNATSAGRLNNRRVELFATGGH